MTEEKSIAYYRQLPYRRKAVLVEEEDGARYFVAHVAEIPWINIDGDTREEALMRLDEIFDDAIQSMLDASDDIPEPMQWPMSVGYEPRPASFFDHGEGELTEIQNLPTFTTIAPPEEMTVG